MARCGKERDSQAFCAGTPTARHFEKWQPVVWRSRKTVIFAVGAELWRAVVRQNRPRMKQ
jgi:hypothetical protein